MTIEEVFNSLEHIISVVFRDFEYTLYKDYRPVRFGAIECTLYVLDEYSCDIRLDFVIFDTMSYGQIWHTVEHQRNYCLPNQ